MHRRALGLILLAFLPVSCSDDDSPTAPNEPAVSFMGEIRNSPGEFTILVMSVELDGREVRAGSATPASNRMSLNMPTLRPVARGRHTLAVYIHAQTSSPNTYTAGADVLVFDNERLLRTVSLAEKTESLSSGQAITFSFDL